MTSLPITYAEDEPAMTNDPDSVHPSAADAVAVSGSDVPARPTLLAEGFLCKAWGETDLPEARLVRTREEWEAFVVEAQWGDDATYNSLNLSDEDRDMVDAQVRYIAQDMADNGEGQINFEIGGMSVERVTFPSPPLPQEQGAVPQWMPIETAPNGDKVLLWCVNAYTHAHVKTGFALKGGRVFSIFDDGDTAGHISEEFATHWMPLPAPPVADPGQAQMGETK